MHLLPPMFSTTGKKKGKQKWASAEAKRQAEQLEKEWQAVVAKYETKSVVKTTTSPRKLKKPPVGVLRIPEGRGTRHIPSLDTGLGNASLPAAKVYTGDKVKGIATMHKSNAVPVFTDEQAQDISKMRRG
jgi:hypothetical protein